MKLLQLICTQNIAYRRKCEKYYCYITEVVLNYILSMELDQISTHCSFIRSIRLDGQQRHAKKVIQKAIWIDGYFALQTL